MNAKRATRFAVVLALLSALSPAAAHASWIFSCNSAGELLASPGAGSGYVNLGRMQMCVGGIAVVLLDVDRARASNIPPRGRVFLSGLESVGGNVTPRPLSRKEAAVQDDFIKAARGGETVIVVNKQDMSKALGAFLTKTHPAWEKELRP